MSDLNGESLNDWVRSERKRAQAAFYLAQKNRDEDSEAYHAGVMDILDVLRVKLRDGRVNPFGDTNPVSR